MEIKPIAKLLVLNTKSVRVGSLFTLK